jgi:hypothetical protein
MMNNNAKRQKTTAMDASEYMIASAIAEPFHALRNVSAATADKVTIVSANRKDSRGRTRLRSLSVTDGVDAVALAGESGGEKSIGTVDSLCEEIEV